MSHFVNLIIVAFWLAGIVLAKGFWWTVAAIVTPYGLYLVAEKALKVAGWVL